MNWIQPFHEVTFGHLRALRMALRQPLGLIVSSELLGSYILFLEVSGKESTSFGLG